jgi:hemin uptake protein HemP
MEPSKPVSASSDNNGAARGPARRVASTELLGLVGHVDIEHRGQIYRLTQTRQGKLILTK